MSAEVPSDFPKGDSLKALDYGCYGLARRVLFGPAPFFPELAVDSRSCHMWRNALL